MNDRLVTAAGALGALLVLAVLLFQGGGGTPVTRPTSVETGPNGYAALSRWLRNEGVNVVSLRRRAEVLEGGELDVPETGNLLITTMPHRDRLRLDESRVLWRWITAGNTVLIMAALDDTPEWSLNVDTTYFLDDLERLTGLSFAAPRDEDARRTIGTPLTATPVTLRSIPAHPLMQGVTVIEGISDSAASVWEATRQEDDYRPALKLAVEPQSGVAGMWQVRYGEGHVIVCGLGSPLTNRVIGAADNAALVANLLEFHVPAGGSVIFDDMHQGLTTLYDPDAFFEDPRLGTTLLFLLGFWLLYLLGTNNRLTPLRQRPAAPSQGDFVAGIGGFLARKLARPEAGRLMVAAWFDELRRRGAIPLHGAPWESLAAVPTVETDRLARLRVYHDAMERGEEVDLRELHNTLEQLRRMLK